MLRISHGRYSTTRLLAIASFALALGAVRARADALPPDESACVGKALGDQCADGVCADAGCSRLNYAGWDRDASSSPPTYSYPCVKCVEEDEKSDGGCSLGHDSSGSQAWLFGLLGSWLLGRRRKTA